MGKKVLGTILLVGLGAVLTIGAIRAFGAPQEILPEDEKMMECIGTVTMDDFVENSKYRKSSDPTYGDSYTLELFEYTLDSKEDIKLRLLNYIEDGKGFTDTRVLKTSGPRHAGFTILNSKVHYVEMDYYSTIERDIQTYKGVTTYTDDGTGYMQIFGAEECVYSQALTSLNNAVENLEELVSISFYRFKNDPIEVEETKVSNKVTIDLTYNKANIVELDQTSLLEVLNDDRKNDIFTSAETVLGIYQGNGGLLSETGEFDLNINSDDYEFNRAKIVVRNVDNAEQSIGFNGKNTVLYVDYEEESDNELKTEVYLAFDEPMTSLAFDGTNAKCVIHSITLWNETVVEAE